MLHYDLTFEERQGYLYACVTAASIDRAAAVDYLQKIGTKVKDRGITRLVLERDIPVMLPAADLFFTTQDFISMAGTTRVAFVNKYAANHAEMEFAMTVGTNRGANYRLFTNVPEAEEWVLADLVSGP